MTFSISTDPCNENTVIFDKFRIFGSIVLQTQENKKKTTFMNYTFPAQCETFHINEEITQNM